MGEKWKVAGATSFVVVVLALFVLKVEATGEVYDSRCDYVIANKTLCTEYPFLGDVVRCSCPDDNLLNDWFCCVNGPLPLQPDGSFPPPEETGNVDCWCESDFTAGGWALFGTLYGVALLAGIGNAYYVIHTNRKNKKRLRREQQEEDDDEESDPLQVNTMNSKPEMDTVDADPESNW